MPVQMKQGKKDKKKKLKQKQKQKQVVKQNVKVTVQSSGGSGGGGSSVPSRFTDTSGENVRLQGLIEQLSRRIPMSVPVSSAPAYNPLNDADTLKSVFEAPIDYDKPIELGNISSAKLSKEIFSRMPPSEAYAQVEAPSAEEEVPIGRRKDFAKPRGSYKEKAIQEGRNIQNIFALAPSEITSGASKERSSMFSDIPTFVSEL